MTTEFDVLLALRRDFVAGIMDPRLNADAQWTRSYFDREIDALKQQINTRVYYYENIKGDALRYIRYVEKTLLKLSVEVLAFTKEFILFNEALDELLAFLMSDFIQYFDYNMAATRTYIDKVVAAQKVYTNAICISLQDPLLDSRLTRLINKYLNLEGYTIRTFNEAIYYSIFCEKVCHWFTGDPHQNMQSSLIRGLIYLNFNTLSFMEFLRTQVSKEYPDPSSYQNGARECVTQLRNLIPLVDEDKYAYNQSRTRVKKALISLYKAELDYLNNLCKLDSDSIEVEDIPDYAPQYIKVNLTVPQLAYLARVLVELKIIVPNTMEGLYLFLATCFRTKGQPEDRSQKNMKNSYLGLTYATFDFTKQLFIKMLEHLRDNKLF